MNAVELEKRLIALVEAERRESFASLREVHDLSLEERVAQGEAIRGLRIVRRDGNTLLLQVSENGSRFRDSDLMWLSTGDPAEKGALAVSLRDFDSVRGEIVVEIDSRKSVDLAALERAAELVLDRRDLDLADRMVDALRAVCAPRSEHAAARDLMLGTRACQTFESLGSESMADVEELDPEQRAAFLGATSRAFQLVQGPPGAGKTKLAGAILRAFLAQGQIVCVTAFTHRAVNNVLARLVADSRLLGIPVYKIERGGTREFGANSGVTVVPSARNLPAIERGPCVVGVTTHSAVTLLQRRFDLVLIDEAGQVSLPHGCVALALGRRHVLVGDHRQLPPLVVAQRRDTFGRKSLFEHLHDAFGSQMLKTTYRMNAEICRLPSAAFYGGALHPAAFASARRLEVSSPSPYLAPEPPALIVPFRHRGCRVLAPSEARFAADLVRDALAAGIPASEIAVIAPHRAQGNRIRMELRTRLPDLPADQRPVVDTVERLQGGERDLVIVSLTASDPDAMHRDADFFFSPNRLNVALTRARRKLIVLMSEALLDAYPDDARALRGADFLRRAWNELPHLEPPAALA